jgi:hypothetical protein
MFRFQIARLLSFEDYLPEAINLERAVPDEIATLALRSIDARPPESPKKAR